MNLEQPLIRSGLTWTRPTAPRVLPSALPTFELSSADSQELRLYQEAFIPRKLRKRFYFSQRFRLEQRWLEDQDERNRLCYFLQLNYPLNQNALGKGAVYLSFYNDCSST